MRLAPEQTLILGPPGTGKTTRSLDIVESEMAAGVAPDRIAYISFTKKAIEEAIERAVNRFSYARSDFKWFRTLHSACYQVLHLRQSDIMGKLHYDELGEILGYKFAARQVNPEDGFPVDAGRGDKLLFMDGLARNRRVTLETQWHDVNDYDLDVFELYRLSENLHAYKLSRSLLDYTDMLEKVVEEQRSIKVDVVVIDEAQDLSALQWEACKTLFKHAKRVYIAGDDDQAIYRWSGADVEQFLSLEGRREVLGKSYRLPRSVHALACRVIGRVQHRFDKQWAARDEDGIVARLPHVDSLELDESVSTLILARNGYQLNDAEGMLRRAGYIYTTRYGESSVTHEHYMAIRAWEKLRKGAMIRGNEVAHVFAQLRTGVGIKRGFKGGKAIDSELHYDMQELRDNHGLLAQGIWHEALDGIALNTREYYITAMRRGAKLNSTPSIRISTIHAAKGGEADHVYLLTDMSQRTFRNYQQEPDDEHRVFYVGMTRAKQRLSLIDAKGEMGFSI